MIQKILIFQLKLESVCVYISYIMNYTKKLRKIFPHILAIISQFSQEMAHVINKQGKF